MLKNNTHNLIQQISEMADSIWRIEKHYLEESDGCEECLAVWRALHQDLEKHIALLQAELKKHLND